MITPRRRTLYGRARAALLLVPALALTIAATAGPAAADSGGASQSYAKKKNNPSSGHRPTATGSGRRIR